ncbi:hypothetical protein [Blastococcus sp. CT_GayMR16]|uniref:hypothetical protein n=1 Tax=Blastococcus sp. CT_GayMR16 TaxID=2559607 RepID=UPI00142F685E|nr:hypothetical protein [Blastococcus sp. CT_GayMR16]
MSSAKPTALEALTRAAAEHTPTDLSPTAARRRQARIPEHLRTDDMQDYLRQKGEIQ